MSNIQQYFFITTEQSVKLGLIVCLVNFIHKKIQHCFINIVFNVLKCITINFQPFLVAEKSHIGHCLFHF